MNTMLTITPQDLTLFRGNRLFGAAGDHAEALMPPWPSVFSGAVRSRILTDKGVDLTRFLEGQVTDPEVKATLGSATTPGPFRLTMLALLAKGRIWFPLPADLVVTGDTNAEIAALEPVPRECFAGACTGYDLPRIPALRSRGPAKPPRRWVSQEGLGRHLAGESVKTSDLTPPETLWTTEDILGIALAGSSGTADEGRIYTSEAVSLLPGVSFAAGFDGHGGLLPTEGFLRLGGDGRCASVRAGNDCPDLSGFSVPVAGGRFRMVLSTPGIFPGGWRPPGVEREEGEYVLHYRGARARLEAAAVPSCATVSGWDVAFHEPKPAVRTVPPGSVYWFEILEGVADGLVDDLRRYGLWPLLEQCMGGELTRDYATRRAEGFNNVWVGHWK